MNFADPSGLDPGDWDENKAGLTNQEINNINSVIRAQKHGYVSQEEMQVNILQNGGMIEKFDPVQITQTGAVVTVTANIVLKGNLVNMIFPGTNKTYGELAIAGVEEMWSGSFNGLSIITKCVISDISTAEKLYKIPLIFIINETADANEHSATAPNGYSSKIFSSDARGDSDKAFWKTYSLDEFKFNAGHEFGHSGLRIMDNYGSNDKNITHKFPSVMGEINVKKWGRKARPIDFAMMLESGGKGHMIRYSQYPSLLDKYAPGWNN